MKSYFLLLAFLLLVFPVSANSVYFEDCEKADYYVVGTDLNSLPHSYQEGLSWKFVTAQYDSSEYNTFTVSENDVIDTLDFSFSGGEDFSMPVTFWYPDDTSKQLTISVDYDDSSYWYFWFTHQMTIEVLDNSTVIASHTYTDIFDDSGRVLINSEGITITQSRTIYLDDPVNLSMDIFPLRAVSFDLPAGETTSSCVIKVLDNSLVEMQLNGWLGWAYTKIKSIDNNYVLYDILLFIQYMWIFLSFIIWLLVFGGWSYFCLVNAFALFYGILQRDGGYFAMLQGYMQGVYFGLLLSVRVFIFCVNIILSLVRIIWPL